MLSVIIVNHNTRQLTTSLIASLNSHITGYPMEILVVDNGSQDGSARCITERFPDVNVLVSTVNLGFGRAVNLAAERCSGDYMWLINSDCLIDDDVAEKMIRYLKDHPDTAAVTGRLVSNDGTFQASCRNFPTFRNLILSRQSPISRLFPSRSDYTLPDFGSPTPVDACACSCTMIRKRDFIEVGGFDPRFFMYCEDTDLCLRFAANGKKVVFLPDAEVTHLWARSWKGDSWLRHYHHHRSMIRYFRKHNAEKNLEVEILEFLLILGLGIRVLVSLFRRDR